MVKLLLHRNVWQRFASLVNLFGALLSLQNLAHIGTHWQTFRTKTRSILLIFNFFAEISRKLLFFQTDFLRKFWDCSGAKGCKSCRAWKMLSNAYFLAKFRFDTAENEPAKNLQNVAKFTNFADPNPLTLTPNQGNRRAAAMMMCACAFATALSHLSLAITHGLSRCTPRTSYANQTA